MNDFFRPRRDLIAQRIYDRLCEAQGYRHSRPSTWRSDELFAYFDAICCERGRLGKGPVSLAEVEAVERCAAGHVDYTAKCAYYGAELVRQ